MIRLLAAAVLAAALAPAPAGAADAPRDLFADGLAGWTRFLPDPAADPDATWSFRDGVLACTGRPNGYVRTTGAFSNYVVRLEWRWTAEPGNSGLLLHVGGEDKVWPRSIEAQLKSGSAGDIYLFDDATCNERGEGRLIPKKQPGNERAPGEWNEMEVTCRGDTLTIRVNGIVQNTATGCSVTAGHIALQSEGRPIEFRNATLAPLP